MNKKNSSFHHLNGSAFAVIDIGTTSIRMTVAHIDKNGRAHPLEFLQQAVSLGRDTFTKGNIEKGTIGECVRSLKNFRRVLEEYGVTRDDRIRAVATTAVREAGNRDAFIDRIYIATGLRIEVLDDMDVTRLTFLSARSVLATDASLLRGQIIVCEIGGGSTEVLLLQKGNIVATHSFKLGTLRLREMLEKFNAPVSASAAAHGKRDTKDHRPDPRQHSSFAGQKPDRHRQRRSFRGNAASRRMEQRRAG